MNRILIVGALLVAASLPSALPAKTPLSGHQRSADARLKALYVGYAAWDAKQTAQMEDGRGGLQPGDRLPRVDEASQRSRETHLKALLGKLDSIPVAQLSSGERINAAVFRTVLENALIELRYRTWEMPFNSDSSFWTYLDSDSLDSAADYRRYIARMRDIPRYFDEEIVNMRAGLARGFSVPRATLAGRDASVATFADRNVVENPFYAAFKKMPSIIPAREQLELRDEGVAAIKQQVVPAYEKLLAFIRNEYVPRARTTVSAHDLPDGDAFYRSQIREYTTTEMSAEEIHQLGLKEVARIDSEMRKTMAESGFKGSFEDFLRFLKTDPQFYAKTPDELMGVSAYVLKRVDGKIGNVIGTLPRRRFGLEPVADAIAPFYTSGRGAVGPGLTCTMNTYDLPTRPLYNIPALTLHECAPGHSLQIGIATEQKVLPAFRRNAYFSSTGEGWGLYSEWLGNEMGIYRTPYERFGQLSYEMWRAARLVIDTGIHRYGWSRSQAIDYLASHTALSSHEVETEVDRYISWPGQALSYKLGELTIRRLRSEAEARLGPRFDERGFHDTILALGSVPLSVLEDRIHAWIRAEAGKPAKAN
jgi:uncharacterized protein (DUF885 family)